MNTFKSTLPNNDYGFVAGESASATLSVCVCLSLWVCHKSDQFYRNGSTDQTSWGLARRHQILRPSLPCILRKSGHLQNNGISFWNFGLRKFRHGTSIIVACGQLSWKQVDAQCDKRIVGRTKLTTLAGQKRKEGGISIRCPTCILV